MTKQVVREPMGSESCSWAIRMAGVGTWFASSTFPGFDNVSLHSCAASKCPHHCRKGCGDQMNNVLALMERSIYRSPLLLLHFLRLVNNRGVRSLSLFGLLRFMTVLVTCLGKILFPTRMISAVSGPEMVDKFVGPSEKGVKVPLYFIAFTPVTACKM